jgi:micrococcal nuclease
MYEYSGTILKVVDGDTVHAELDLGLDVRLRTTLRLAGINAPELSTKAGPVARSYLQGLLASERPLVVRTVKDKREKYGRYLAWIFKGGVGDVSVNEQMIEAGQAVAYNP